MSVGRLCAVVWIDLWIQDDPSSMFQQDMASSNVYDLCDTFLCCRGLGSCNANTKYLGHVFGCVLRMSGHAVKFADVSVISHSNTLDHLFIK